MIIEFSINKKKYKVQSKLTGSHNVYNIMASILVSIINKIPIKNIIKIIEEIDSIPGRMEFIGNENKRVFIDYAHTPDAFENILSMVNKIKDKNEKVITLFGCGGDRDKSKREKITSISEKFSDLVIITTDNPRNESIDIIINDMIKGFSKNEYKIIIDRTKAIEYAMEKLDKKSILLILGKGRENYQIVGDVKKKHNDVNIIKRVINES